MTMPATSSDVTEIAARLAADAQVLEGKRVLITGSGGFLGRYYVGALVELNRAHLGTPCQIVALDNSITSEAQSADVPGCTFVQHDVIQPFAWDEKFDYVIHAAGIASPYYYRAFPFETLDVSIIGTRNMLDLSEAHEARMLFMSSSEIYGDPDPDHVPTTESYRGNVAPLGPRACYDEGKRVGETLCYVHHQVKGTSATIARPFNVFGPGMSERDYRVLPNFASCIAGGRPLHVYGSGSQTRTYCYVTDALVGFFKVLLRGIAGEAYNIGNPEPEISVNDLAERIAKVLDRPLDLAFAGYPDTYPADEPERRCPDIRKARLQLGFDPEIDLDEGLRRFLAWTESSYTGDP